MLPSAGEIVRRPHTSLTHHFRHRPQMSNKSQLYLYVAPSWNAELRFEHSPVLMVIKISEYDCNSHT